MEQEDPKMFSKAIASRDISFWKEAIENEMNSILSNNTWVLKDFPLGCKPIKCKWVLRKKRNTDGIVHIFKARLVVKGFTQKG